MARKGGLYLRLSYDLKCIGLGQYEFAARQMDEIGRSITTTTSVFGVLRRQEIGNGLLTTDSVTD